MINNQSDNNQINVNNQIPITKQTLFGIWSFRHWLLFGYCLIGVWSFPSTASADVAIETSVSRSRVSVGEEVTLDIIILNASDKISRPTIASIEGFTSYSQGHSQEITIVNGETSSKSVFSYVLIANSPGEKTIGPFEIHIGDRTYKAAPVKVDVTTSAASPRLVPVSQTPVSAPPVRALPSRNANDQDIFVKAWLDRDEVVVNEPAILTYTLYTRLSATYKGFEKEPQTTGFWVEEFPPDKTIKRTEQMFNGSRYVVADVRKIALFPTQVGVFSIDPGVLSAVVELRDQNDFDSFFSSSVFGQRRVLRSPMLSQIVSKTLPAEKVVLTVKALPDKDKPSRFTGSVGNYQIESSIDKNEVQVGDPVTFRVKVWGEGNINTLSIPAVPELRDFKVYDSATSTNISKNRLMVEGEKSAETVIVPKKAGTVVIPSLSFDYFDPHASAYRQIQTQPHTLVVIPSTEAKTPEPGSSVEPVEKEDVAFVANDIHFIKTDVSPLNRLPELPTNPFYWALNGALLIAYGFISVLARRRGEEAADLKIFRFRRSRGMAGRKLRGAASLLREDRQEAFYDEIAKAVYGYFADRLNRPSQAIDADVIESRAAEEEVSPEMINQIRSLLAELSLGRYGSVKKTKEQMRDLLEKAHEVIQKFEKVRLK
ncbi:MAG: protein BatD [Candidatus Omnitrophica bacterium]|nr:protein BatD [Candidatus Omnitrophota bacterium]